MIRTLLSATTMTVAFGVATAGAATLSVVGSPIQIVNLGTDFDVPVDGVIDEDNPGLGIGSEVSNFTGDFDGGLFVNGRARITITFLGKEADFSNLAVELPNIQSLADDVIGASISFIQNAGFVNFKFATLGSDDFIANGGGTAGEGLDLAFSRLFNSDRSVYALFGDSGGGLDDDFDDFVARIDVAAVPLPAGGLLLLGALGGIAALRRRKAA